jgi:hypothetical protein
MGYLALISPSWGDMHPGEGLENWQIEDGIRGETEKRARDNRSQRELREDAIGAGWDEEESRGILERSGCNLSKGRWTWEEELRTWLREQAIVRIASDFDERKLEGRK